MSGSPVDRKAQERVPPVTAGRGTVFLAVGVALCSVEPDPDRTDRHGSASDGTGSDCDVISGTAGHDVISRRDEARERSLLDSDMFVTRSRTSWHIR